MAVSVSPSTSKTSVNQPPLSFFFLYPLSRPQVFHLPFSQEKNENNPSCSSLKRPKHNPPQNWKTGRQSGTGCNLRLGAETLPPEPGDKESVFTSGRIWAICQKRTSPKPRDLTGARKPEKERVTSRERGPILRDCQKHARNAKETSGIRDRLRPARGTTQVKTQLQRQERR